MIDIELIEQEIISILKGKAEVISTHPEITKSDLKKAALDTLKGLATVESYQGNITEILTDNIIPFPAALVIYGGAKDENLKAREGARGKVIVSFNVFVVGQNLIGRSEASLDVRKMLTAVRTVLNGFIYNDEGKERTLLWMAESLEMISNTGTCAFEQTYQYIDWLIT
jgi:hypothetical protein